MNNTCLQRLHRLHRWPPFTNNRIINIGSCRTHAKYIFIYLLKMILKAWSSLYLKTNCCWAFPSQNRLTFSKSKSKSQPIWKSQLKLFSCKLVRNCRILLNISNDLVGAFSSLVIQFCIILTPFSCSGNNRGYAFHYTWE